MKSKDKEPLAAFPRTGFENDKYFDAGSTGMSLRDWFAGQAMIALLRDQPELEHLSKAAYVIADAMMEERSHS